MQLPDFIESALYRHNTSLGNNKAFPNMEDMSFDEKIIRRRYKEVISSIKDALGYIPTIEEAEGELSKLINHTMKVEKPIRPQLEKLCMAIANNVLGVPQETILLDCKLVDKIDPDVEVRIMPEDDEEEPSYTFEDVDEVNMANDALLKRRMVNSLVQGVSYRLMRAFYDSNKVRQWSSDLNGLYAKIIALNDFLLFSKQERISDKNPMLGAYVETHLGMGDEKTVISAQGLVYPFLLQETFRGFFELFGSHGLPEETKIAMYIIRHADFLVAEAWDLRIGVPLWDIIRKAIDDDAEPSVLPYVFSSIVELGTDEFNDTLKNIFVGTKKGQRYIEDIVNEVIRDEEYNLFKQDIEELNLDKCIITDDEISDGAEENIIQENKYDTLFNKSYRELNSFLTQKEKEYGDSNWFSQNWMEYKHPDINVKPEDITQYNELYKKHDEIARLWNTEEDNEEEEKCQANQEWIERSNEIIPLAIKKFGITDDLKQAGYILPDGRLLNFGQGGERSTDHRAIEGIYLNNNIPIWDNSYRYNYVVDFMNCGAIRCDVNVGLLDMTQEPTNEQYGVIRKFARIAGDVDIDFTDNKGNTQHSVSYSNIKPQRVVADIYKYYNEGLKPQGNVRFEGTDKNGYLITEGISDKTYHYCSLDTLYNILKDGEIRLTMSSNHADAYHKAKLFYLSTQRSKSDQVGYARNSHAECRIELDGYMLKAHGYEGMPLDYWGASMGKQSDIGLNALRIKAYGFRTPETQEDKEALLKSQGESSNFEFEDRIFSNKPAMSLKYVTRIDCINKFNIGTHIDKAILQLAEEKGIKVYFYDNKKDFVLQTNNIKNQEILSSEGEYEDKPSTWTEERRQSSMSDLITNLSAMLFYYKCYNELNSQGEKTLDKELFDVLNKFNLGAFYGYVQEHIASKMMFVEQYFSSTTNQIRKLNTDRFSKSKISNDIMLYGQYVLNKYHVKSFTELTRYFQQHPWKQKRPSQTPIKDKARCVKFQYTSESYQILEGDSTSFWEYVDKERFYDEISRQVEDDEWNSQYNEPNIITHKSKNIESFRKYLQHLMHNDNFSLYDGAVILNKLFNNNLGQMDMMFGFTMEPIELDKDTFIENENRIKLSDVDQIRNELFGSLDGYWEYRWPKSKVNESLYEDSAESAKWNGKYDSYYKEDVKAIPFS